MRALQLICVIAIAAFAAPATSHAAPARTRGAKEKSGKTFDSPKLQREHRQVARRSTRRNNRLLRRRLRQLDKIDAKQPKVEKQLRVATARQKNLQTALTEADASYTKMKRTTVFGLFTGKKGRQQLKGAKKRVERLVEQLDKTEKRVTKLTRRKQILERKFVRIAPMAREAKSKLKNANSDAYEIVERRHSPKGSIIIPEEAGVRDRIVINTREMTAYTIPGKGSGSSPGTVTTSTSSNESSSRTSKETARRQALRDVRDGLIDTAMYAATVYLLNKD